MLRSRAETHVGKGMAQQMAVMQHSGLRLSGVSIPWSLRSQMTPMQEMFLNIAGKDCASEVGYGSGDAGEMSLSLAGPLQ